MESDDPEFYMQEYDTLVNSAERRKITNKNWPGHLQTWSRSMVRLIRAKAARVKDDARLYDIQQRAATVLINHSYRDIIIPIGSNWDGFKTSLGPHDDHDCHRKILATEKPLTLVWNA